MSRAHEASLTNHLARLDHWIAESEALASRSSDEETLRNVAEDLVRLRESRARNEQALRRTKSLNRFVGWTLAAFCISLALLFAIAFFRLDDKLLFLLVAPDLLFLVGSGVTAVVAILFRDAVALGHRPWQFGLRSLLVTTTLIAVLLGLLAYAIRN